MMTQLFRPVLVSVSLGILLIAKSVYAVPITVTEFYLGAPPGSGAGADHFADVTLKYDDAGVTGSGSEVVLLDSLSFFINPLDTSAPGGLYVWGYVGIVDLISCNARVFLENGVYNGFTCDSGGAPFLPWLINVSDDIPLPYRVQITNPFGFYNTVEIVRNFSVDPNKPFVTSGGGINAPEPTTLALLSLGLLGLGFNRRKKYS